jgi:hypothetical protein
VSTLARAIHFIPTLSIDLFFKNRSSNSSSSTPRHYSISLMVSDFILADPFALFEELKLKDAIRSTLPNPIENPRNLGEPKKVTPPGPLLPCSKGGKPVRGKTDSVPG